MKLVLKIILLLTSYGVTFGVGAYEMSSMKVLSSINEPLEAHIAISGGGDNSEDPVVVGMASKIDFMRHQVRRGYYVTDLKASFEKNTQGDSVIKIKSSEPIISRSIDLLVLMLSTKDREFGKYKFVFPSLKIANQLPIIAENRLQRRSTQQLTNVEKSTIDRQPKNKKNIDDKVQNKKIAKETYTVLKGDSLSYVSIKLLTKYPQFNSWKSLMVRLVNMNKKVFPDKNINNLRVGVTLDLPASYGSKMEPDMALSSLRNELKSVQIKASKGTRKRVSVSLPVSNKRIIKKELSVAKPSQVKNVSNEQNNIRHGVAKSIVENVSNREQHNIRRSVAKSTVKNESSREQHKISNSMSQSRKEEETSKTLQVITHQVTVLPAVKIKNEELKPYLVKNIHRHSENTAGRYSKVQEVLRSSETEELRYSTMNSIGLVGGNDDGYEAQGVFNSSLL